MRGWLRPDPPSPVQDPRLWDAGVDCMFVDSEEASVAQLGFLRRATAVIGRAGRDREERALVRDGEIVGRMRCTAEGGVEVEEAEIPSRLAGKQPCPRSLRSFFPPNRSGNSVDAHVPSFRTAGARARAKSTKRD